MKPTTNLLSSLFILLASVAHLAAADWVPLFDGKSLDGWHQVGGEHAYEVVDGMIVGTSVAGEGNAFMTTDKTYQNFELKFEVKVDHRLNSGCQIRSVPVGKSRHLRGPQVEIAGGRSGFIYGEVMKKVDGSPQKWISPNLEDEKTEPIKGAFKVNEWNSFLIRVLDDHYQTSINGVLITDFKFDGMPDAGHIGLQVHGVKKEDLVGKRVRWKNIQLKQLKSAGELDEATTETAAEEAESAAVMKLGEFGEPPTLPYLATSEGREGYALAGERTNSYRVYDFYKRQAQHHLKQDRDLALLPAYPDLDGGSFGHWGNYNENGHQDLRWNDMDYGPAMAASYSVDRKKKIGGMLSVLTEGGHTVTFNKETGSYYNTWEGRPYFHPHRWGVIHGVAVPEGVPAKDLRPWFPAITQNGNTMTRYLGHYLHGKRVATHYEIGGSRFLDSVSGGEHGMLVRSLVAMDGGAVTLPLNLEDQPDWKVEVAENVIIATREDRTLLVAAKAFAKGEPELLTPVMDAGLWKAPARAEAFTTYFWEGEAAQADAVMASIRGHQKMPALDAWTRGGPSSWPERFTEPVTIAKDERAYVVDRIGVPFDNPWGSMMLFSGIDFDAAGHAYLPTLMGDVWKVSGLGKGMKEVSWKRFATGLNQPFGIRLIDGHPHVMTRGSIVCLKDMNGDDEADYYQDSFNGFTYSPSAHTRTFGLSLDKDRTAYFVNGSGAYKKPWNQPAELLASGLRNAMAVGGSQDGLFLVGPQEGVWTPSSAVLEIGHGDYYGMGPDHVKDGRDRRAESDLTPAMAYLPRGIDNSTGGFEFPVSEQFGPLNGSIVGLSYGYGSWYRILRNDNYADYDRAQGTIVPLAGEFRAGVVRGAMHPGDGQFYVAGSDGWGNYALDDGSLERVRYTGKALPMLKKVHAHENGIELQFSDPLTGEAASNAENYFVQQWNYEYSPAYGSLEFSVKRPSQEGHDRIAVARAEILPGRTSVFLEIPDLLPALQTHIYVELETEAGPLEVNAFATLVHLDAAKPGFAEPVPALKSRTAALRVRGSKVAQEKVAANTANTPAGRFREGETLFKMFCTGCHGPQGKGLPKIAPTLHSDWVAGDSERLIKLLLHGIDGEIEVNGELQQYEAPMPAFGAALGDAEIANILSYVRKSWSETKANTDVTAEQVQQVRQREAGITKPYEAQDLWKADGAAAIVADPEQDQPVHLFILSGQSNMQGMDPETGFLPEANKLFNDEKVVYIKVAKGGQPICRWLEEWTDIAKQKGLDEKHRRRIHRDGKVEFYQPILDQYKEMLKKHPKPASVTFCWMQGERDANGGAHAPYKDACPDMNIVIGRIGDYAMDRPSCVAVRKAQREIVKEDPRGAWIDVDDLNDREVDGVMKSAVHYNRPDGYVILGQRFARQGYALVKGKKPAEDGKP